MVNSDTRLCSYIPETRNIVVSDPDQSYVLKTGSDKMGSLKIASESPPAGIIGFGLSVSTILLEIVLGDRPDDFFDVLPCLKLKWPQKHANQVIGSHYRSGVTSGAVHAVQHETGFRLLDLKRLRFTPGELSSDQTAVIIDQ